MELYYLNSPYIVNSEMRSIDDFLYMKAKPFVHSAFTRAGLSAFVKYLRAEHDACIASHPRLKPSRISDPYFQKDLFGHEEECVIHLERFSLNFNQIIHCVDDDFVFNEAQQP